MISVAGLIALILCLLFGIPYIDFMKKKAYSQYIREEGIEQGRKETDIKWATLLWVEIVFKYSFIQSIKRRTQYGCWEQKPDSRAESYNRRVTRTVKGKW